ncbi:glycosyltransferase [bacterium CPR1]|nr:glycosyltransferase [bacterium CPR1]
MKHLCLSYHTCPLEETGTGLAGGMNVYLRGLLPALEADTLVLTAGQRSEEIELGRSRILRIPCKSEPWTREQAFQALPEFVRQARERIHGQAFEAVSAHYWMSALAAEELVSGLKPVVMFHSLDPQRNPVRRQAERGIAARAASVVFSSALDRAVSQPSLPELSRARIIRPGLDPAFHPRDRSQARQALGLPEHETLIGLVARDDPAKNAALARQVTRDLGLTLVEVPGPRWPRGLPHHRMPDYYASMDLLLAIADYETFGLSVLEALASGCRVLVSDRGYWGAMGRRTGAVRVTALQDLGHNLQLALQAPPPDRTLQSHFTWPRAARRWLSALLQSRPEKIL